LWGFAGGLRPPAKPFIFFAPSPTAHTLLGRGLGKGKKLPSHKSSSIAVWLPGARLNSYEI